MGRVSRTDDAGMAGTALATRGEIFADRRADQGAVPIVTARAAIVDFRVTGINQWRRIIVAVRTQAGCSSHQVGVSRGVVGMSLFPGVGMTGCTITRRDFSRCKADQAAGHGIVTAGAGKV